MADGNNSAGPTEQQLTRAGLNVLLLSSYGTVPYLERRVERIEFLDAQTAVRSVEVHLRLSGLTDVKRYPLLDGALLLPIATLRRFKDDGTVNHSTLSLVDEAGWRIPRLTMDEERALVFRGLWRLARQRLGQDPAPSTNAVLSRITYGDEGIDPLLTSPEPQVVLLRNSPGFAAVASDANALFHVIAPLKPDSYSRRVVVYSYHEQPTLDDGLAGAFFGRIFKPQPGVVVRCDTPMADFCRSYHFEMCAPPELLLPHGRASLDVHRIFADEADPPILDDDRSNQRAHVYFQATGPIRDASFKALLVLDETGVIWGLRACVAVAWLLTAVATAFSLFASPVALDSVDRSALATLMLLAPAVVTTALAIRSRHGLSSRMARGARGTAAAPVLGILAATLVSSMRPVQIGAVQISWAVALAIATLAAVRVVAEFVWLRSARKGPI